MLLTEAPPSSTPLVENVVVDTDEDVVVGLVDIVVDAVVGFVDDIVAGVVDFGVEKIYYPDNSIEDDHVYYIDNIFYNPFQNVVYLSRDLNFAADNDQMLYISSKLGFADTLDRFVSVG
jgi:hypothetical protein